MMVVLDFIAEEPEQVGVGRRLNLRSGRRKGFDDGEERGEGKQ